MSTPRGTHRRGTDVDPFAPAMIVDPYPTYARLRAAGPVYLDPPGTWFLARHADVQQILRDPRFGRAGFGAVLDAEFGPGPVQRRRVHRDRAA